MRTGKKKTQQLTTEPFIRYQERTCIFRRHSSQALNLKPRLDFRRIQPGEKGSIAERVYHFVLEG